MVFQHIEYQFENGTIFPFSILREDLSQPLLQGNKFWKLKYNIQEVLKTEHKRLLTFGGAYSNHIHATAIAGHLHGIETIAIIRGEEPTSYSPTLQFAKEKGMKLHFISRKEYRRKDEVEFIQSLTEKFRDFHLVPEGGSNELGLKGCIDWGNHISGNADIYCLAAGTATTAAGIAQALVSAQPKAEVWAFSALKNGGFLKEEAENMTKQRLPNLKIITDYHFGGYAKYNKELLDFMDKMDNQYHLPLEQVYTSKTLFGLFDMAHKGLIPADKQTCFIHTGGLQGRLIKSPYKK